MSFKAWFFLPLMVLVFGMSLTAPLMVHAADKLPVFSPGWTIVPDAHALDPVNCPVGSPLSFGGVLQLIQNLLNGGVSLAVLIAVLVIVYAGIMFIVTPVNPEGHSKAKAMLLDAVVGLLIVLSAWLMVDFVMKMFYNPQSFRQGRLGGWNAIIRGGDACIKQVDPTKIDTSGLSTNLGADVSGTDVEVDTSKLFTGQGDCSASAIQQAAAAGGYTLTDAQAETFSCLATPESNCGKNTSIPTTPDGAQTTARGMFQVTIGASDKCHSLNIPVCSQIASSLGYADVLDSQGNLQCSRAFSGGRAKSDAASQRLASACTAAALNLNCNASAAACLLKNNPSFSDWTADSRASVQRACIAKFNH